MVHLNVKDHTPEDIPYSHFLNLAEENPDASTEANIFGYDDYTVDTIYE